MTLDRLRDAGFSLPRLLCPAGRALAGGLLGILVVAGGLLGQSAAAPPDEAQLRKWVTQLDSNVFNERDAATTALAEAGQVAVPLIVAALREASPEVAMRGVAILRKIAISGDAESELAARNGLAQIANQGNRLAASYAQRDLDVLDRILQQQALNALVALGAKVQEGYRQTLPGQAEIYVQGVTLDDEWKGTDKDILKLRFLREIERITLEGARVRTSWLKPLAALPNLQLLAIKRAELDDAAIKLLTDLRAPNLELEFKYVPITDGAVPDLAGMKFVSALRIYGTKITPAGAANLKNSLPDVDFRQGAFLGVGCNPNPVGCEILVIHPNSAADRAGFRPGDIIVRYNQEVVLDFENLTKKISQHRGGEKTTITVARGATDPLEFDLQNWLVQQRAAKQPLSLKSLGVEFKPQVFGTELTAVAEGSAAEKAGLRKGDVVISVNLNRTLNPQDVDKQFQALAAPQPAADGAVPPLRVAVVRSFLLVEREVKLGEWE